jgi:hypothetical protein
LRAHTFGVRFTSDTMQKFGLQRNSTNQHSAIELEIAREKASALGRAGKKLRLSLESYQARLNLGLSSEQKESHLKEISNNVWELFIQREFIGFVEGNMKWVRDHYVIPDEALTMLGNQS